MIKSSSWSITYHTILQTWLFHKYQNIQIAWIERPFHGRILWIERELKGSSWRSGSILHVEAVRSGSQDWEGWFTIQVWDIYHKCLTMFSSVPILTRNDRDGCHESSCLPVFTTPTTLELFMFIFIFIGYFCYTFPSVFVVWILYVVIVWWVGFSHSSYKKSPHQLLSHQYFMRENIERHLNSKEEEIYLHRFIN